MENIFCITKEKPRIKLKGYTYLGAHNVQPGICYYVRKYDNHKNFDFVEAKLGTDFNKKFIRSTILEAGTSIKVIDTLMAYYLEHLKGTDFKSNKKFIKKSLEDADVYTKDVYNSIVVDVPKEFKTMQEYKSIIKQGYKVLYCQNSNPKVTTIDRHTVVFVKEVHEELIDTKIEYVSFKTIELITKMEYLKKGSGTKYNVLPTSDVSIPYCVLMATHSESTE